MTDGWADRMSDWAKREAGKVRNRNEGPFYVRRLGHAQCVGCLSRMVVGGEVCEGCMARVSGVLAASGLPPPGRARKRKPSGAEDR